MKISFSISFLLLSAFSHCQLQIGQVILPDGMYYYNVYKCGIDSVTIGFNKNGESELAQLRNVVEITDTTMIWSVLRMDSNVVQTVNGQASGLFNGVCKVFNDCDSVLIHFRNGKKNGLAYWYNDDFLRVENFENDLLEGTAYTLRYWNNLESLTEYHLGKKHGLSLIWWTTSTGRSLQSSYCYYDDKIVDGDYVTYHPNGNKFIECSYKNGIYNGEFLEYDSNGTLFRRTNYKNGKRISISKD